uniref:THUMP domain-containing protein n=1 Tax=Panagrolaimus sp. ES5 TaxID=591445 RepID=A0AC34GRV0_9BILA
MSRPSNQKRSNYYSQNQGYKTQKQLDWNKYGLWFTCEFEREGVREAHNIVSKFLNEPSGSEPSSAPAVGGGGDASGEMDIADELTKQIEEANRPNNSRRIRQQPTGVKHCLFFTVADISRAKITDFVEKLVDECQKTQQCRYLLRVLPIKDISPSEPHDLKTNLRQILKTHFDEFSLKPENAGKHATFAVDYKKRFSDQISRQQALDIVCEIVEEIDPESKVNLTQPDFTILFHVVKKAVLLGCLKNFNQKRKYALKVQNEKEEDGESSPAKKKKEDEEEVNADEEGEEEKKEE